MKRWDGKFKFFSNANRTYLSIIIEIVDELKKRGYKIRINNRRRDFNLHIPPVDENYFSEYEFKLGKHQVKAINNTLKGHHGIIRVGTGGGKTLITAVLADLYTKHNYKTIVIVPNKDLITQTKDELSSFGMEVGAYYSKEKITNKPVTISTWQSLNNNPNLLSSFNAVMVDECHGSQAQNLFKLLSNQGKNIPVRIGLTGTIPEHMCDKLKVFSVLGPVKATVPANYLMKIGWLAKLNLLMVQYKEEFVEEWEHFKQVSESTEDKTISYKEFKNHRLFPAYENEKTYFTNYCIICFICKCPA